MKNITINLILPDTTMSIPVLQHSENLPRSLVMVRIGHIGEIPEELAPSLEATILLHTEDSTSDSKIDYLKISLNLEDGGTGMIELMDPDDSSQVFIITSSNENTTLALLKYSLDVQTGLLSYLVSLKRARSSIFHEVCTVKRLTKDHLSEQETIKNRYICTSEITKKLSHQLRTTKKAAKQLNDQVNNQNLRLNEGQNLMCSLCHSAQKCIVMLPCGHITVCPSCLDGKPIGRKLTKNARFACILCRGTVCELRLVKFG